VNILRLVLKADFNKADITVINCSYTGMVVENLSSTGFYGSEIK
jgi:hypothetical protein